MSKIQVEFRGQTFEVEERAVRSMKLQYDLSRMGESDEGTKAAWHAFDLIMCGQLGDALSRIPEEDGEVDEYGASPEAVLAFMEAAGRAIEKN